MSRHKASISFYKPFVMSFHPTQISKALLTLSLFILLSCTPNPTAYREPLDHYLAEANALIAGRRYTEAVQTLEEAAEVYPDSLAPLIRIGQIYLAQHCWLLAGDAFNRALARDLQSGVATAGLAESLLKQGQTVRALDLWQKAMKLNPDVTGAFTGLGVTHLALLGC